MNVLRPAIKRSVPKQLCRCASLDSAIHRGIRQESREQSRTFNRPREDEGTSYSLGFGRERQKYRSDDRYDSSYGHYDSPKEYTRTPRRTIQKVNQDSEWIYGTSVVEAALKSRRRKLYRLHVYAGENRTSISRERDIKLKNLARGLKIDVREVTDVGHLDSMSNSRPHNGYVLEASPLQKIPILSLAAVSPDKNNISLQIAQHDITNTGIILSRLPNTIPNRDPKRFPLILMLDEILDPGNLGAILRTAYFMGCSALLVSERNCAPLSPTCLKSSAGASEYMPILTQTSPARMIANSQANGWKFFAAVPTPAKYQGQRRYIGLHDKEVKEALIEGPTVLVMGSEGEGLRESVKKACDRCVSISGAADVDRGVDSLNVSVAAGVLCHSFLLGK